MAIKPSVVKGEKVATEQNGVKEVVATEKTAPKKPTGVADLKAQGEQIYASKSEEERSAMGSKSDTVEFISLITNPYFSVSRKEKDGKVVKGEETVGAIFKNVGTEPLTVKTFPNKTYNVMDADFEKMEDREIAPGEEFQMTSVEVAELMTRDEFGSRITGGGKIVSYTTQTPKDPTQMPTTKLRIKDGSVKEFSVSIADTSADGKTKTMKEEFQEKFGIFATRGTRRNSVGGRSKAPKVNPAGLAVQALFRQKMGQ